MTQPLLQIRGLQKRFGGLIVTDDVDLDVVEGQVHALIGPNGAGKTTLIAQLFGEIEQDAGEIWLDGRNIARLATALRVQRGLARTFQIAQLLPDYTVFETVLLAVQAQQGRGFRFIGAVRRDKILVAQATRHLSGSSLAERAKVKVADLSYGEQKQLELILAVVSAPRLLLLDEPMAGLGHAESEQMIQELAALKGRISILLIEHDMDAVFALADRISVLVYGRVIATGSVEEIRNNELVRSAYLGGTDA